jgi:hypothetical protein
MEGEVMASRQPAHEIRRGRVKAAIWVDDAEGGRKVRVAFTRLYRDGAGWKDSRYLGSADLAAVARVAEEVMAWLAEQAAGSPLPG